jgi:transcriptional regulator with XRE-family HTH domain
MRLGANLREARSRRGWSIADLAAAAGLSKGFVSQVENDKTSPSLDTLERLAAALEMPIIELLRAPDATPPAPYVLRRAFAPDSLLPNRRGPEVVALTPPGGPLSVYIVELPAGAALGDSSHSHEGAESCLVLAGQAQADQAGVWTPLAVGDAVTWTPGQRHRLINPGPGPARLLISLTAPATLGAALPAATRLQAPEDRQPVERPLRLVQMRAARRARRHI